MTNLYEKDNVVGKLLLKVSLWLAASESAVNQLQTTSENNTKLNSFSGKLTHTNSIKQKIGLH